jgi:hypothetical protein
MCWSREDNSVQVYTTNAQSHSGDISENIVYRNIYFMRKYFIDNIKYLIYSLVINNKRNISCHII